MRDEYTKEEERKHSKGKSPCIQLNIDEEFQRLVYPMDRQSLLRLEENIRSGCVQESLVVWNGYLIDGFDQYTIYCKYKLPFQVEDMKFRCRETAVAWSCARQLQRKDIPEALRRFLIGIQYRAEATAAKQFPNNMDGARRPVCHQIAERIGRENHVACETVKRFSSFAGTLEDIRNRAPAAAEKIMYGTIKIADKHLLGISRLDEPAFQRALVQLGTAQRPPAIQRRSGKKVRTVEDAIQASAPGPSVKDMPAFDPDAEVTGLALTVPSWIGSMDRVIQKTDLSIISEEARERLVSALLRLQSKVSEMYSIIEVE